MRLLKTSDTAATLPRLMLETPTCDTTVSTKYEKMTEVKNLSVTSFLLDVGC